MPRPARDRREAARGDQEGRLQGTAPAGHRPHQHRCLHPQHADGSTRSKAMSRRWSTSTGDASGRAADARNGRSAVPWPVLRPEERYDLSAVGRVKMNMRLELDAPTTPCACCARKTSLPWSRRWSNCGRQGRDRRHRPPRQPPCALGRRADGEPVSRRPGAHGARDQGAHVVGRYRHRDAA
jgi:hypothetical protein